MDETTSVLLGLDENVEGRPRPAVRCALGQVKDRPLTRRLEPPSTDQRIQLGP